MYGMATGASGWKLFFFISSFLTAVKVASSLINLPECKSCSGRPEIPCVVQQMQYPCFHTEYHDYWPGKPKNLEAKSVKVGDRKWIANFTWSPPYDERRELISSTANRAASIVSLNGFFLTVNLVAHMRTVIAIGPLCFYANLSGTNWTSIHEPHAVTFHFDCIVAEVKTEVHLFLMSSPKPDHGADYTDTLLSMGDMPRTREAPLKINNTVYIEDGESCVSVWFGPLEPGILYHLICLASERVQGYCTQQANLSVPEQDYVFTDVPSGDYKIMIRRSSGQTWFVTKTFFVPEPPPVTTPLPESKSIDAFQILLIIGCALLAVATTAIIYVLRRYAKWKYCDFLRCFMVRRYQPTAQIQPNNNNDQLVPGAAMARKRVMMIFYPECSAFVEAVEDLSTFITKWGDCDVIPYQNICTEAELAQKIEECSNGHFICIILSEHINMVYEILTHGENLPNDSDLQTQFIFEFLKNIHSKGKQKTVVSFFPVQLDNVLLKDEKILTITEKAGTKLETSKANLIHIFQLFHKIHDNEFSVAAFQESMATGNEQMTKLLKSIQNLPKGLVTGDKLDNSNVQLLAARRDTLMSDSENMLPEDLFQEGNNNIAQKNLTSKLCDKQLDTLKWTEEQNRLLSGNIEIKWSPSHPYTKNGIDPQVGYQPIKTTECDLDLSCTCDRSCSENDDLFTVGYPKQNEAPMGPITFSCEKPMKMPLHRQYQNSDSHLRLKESFGNSDSQKRLKESFGNRIRYCRRGKKSTLHGGIGFDSLRDDMVYPASKADDLLEEGYFIPPDSDIESDTQSMLLENINRRYAENTQQCQSMLEEKW